MGITTATVKIRNPKDETKVIEEGFLVDSGATFSVVPNREQKFALADVGIYGFSFGSLRAKAPPR